MNRDFGVNEKILDMCADLLDHIPLLEQLKEFRKNPQSIIPKLEQRKKKYREIKGKQYLFSDKHRKKAVQIKQEQKPEARIDELISIISSQQPLGEMFEIPKLTECASKLSQTISKQISSQIHFKPGTSAAIRQIIDSDQLISFPNKVVCLLSLSFHEESETPLINLLIDDDIQDRPNRSALLDPKYKYIGAFSSISPDKNFMACTVYLLTDKAIAKQTKKVLLDTLNTALNE